MRDSPRTWLVGVRWTREEEGAHIALRISILSHSCSALLLSLKRLQQGSRFWLEEGPPAGGGATGALGDSAGAGASAGGCGGCCSASSCRAAAGGGGGTVTMPMLSIASSATNTTCRRRLVFRRRLNHQGTTWGSLVFVVEKELYARRARDSRGKGPDSHRLNVALDETHARDQQQGRHREQAQRPSQRLARRRGARSVLP